MIFSKYFQKKQYAGQGQVFDRHWDIQVDHPLVAQWLSNKEDPEVVRFFQEFNNQQLSSELMAEITNRYSADCATMFYIHKVYSQTQNNHAQKKYWKNYLSLKKDPSLLNLDELKKYYVVFVPGWGYIDDKTTGADFSRQRLLLDNYGIENTLIETGEYDLVDHNAPYLANRLKELSKDHENILLVSASKGGLETSLALGKHLSSSEIASIKIWVSAGGILRGSPLADIHLRGLRRLFLTLYLRWKGQSLNIIRDMSYQTRKAEFEKLHYPENLNIYHLVGAPWSMNISPKIKGRYHLMLRNFGPNDGLTPIADELTEKGTVITELGLDHYFQDPDIDLKTMALALIAIEEDIH